MERTEIILVRHGQTEWNRVERFRGRADIPLNETGLAQAEAVADRIGRKFRPAAVYSSPLSRATKTAEPIARVTSLSVQLLDGLVDIDYGEWQGLTTREAEARDPNEYRLWLGEPHRARIPGGEILDQVRARALSAVKAAAGRHAGQAIVLVSHKAVCKVLLCAVLGLDNSHFWRIEQDNAAMSIFDHRDGANIVKLVNDTCHLERVLS